MDYLSFDRLILTENKNPGIRERHRLIYLESSSWYSSLIDHESSDAKKALTYINDSLNDPCLKRDGLQLLTVLVHQATQRVIFDSYRGWIPHLRKFILHDCDLNVRLLAIKILGKILFYCHSDCEHSRYLASNLVPNIMPHLLDLEEKMSLVFLYGIYFFLSYLPGPSRPFMAGMQKRLLESLNSNNSEVMEISAKCISRIPLTVGDAARGSTQGSTWLEYFQKLVQTLNSLLNFLYKDFELEKPPHIDLSEQIPLPLTFDCNDGTSYFMDSFSRCTSICLCLEEMLKHGDQTLMPIPIDSILQTVSRILKVNGKNVIDNKSSAEKDLLFTILPLLHCSALKVLEALTICCRKHLLIHDGQILNLLFQSLSWPSTLWKTENAKCALSKLRAFTYRVLITWCQTMGSSTDIAIISDSLLKRMISDAFNGQHFSKDKDLTITEVQKPSTKKRKVEPYLNLGSKSNEILVTDEELCYLCLKAVRVLFHNSSEDFKSSGIKDLFRRVTDTLFQIQSHSIEGLPNVHFRNDRCRKALYNVLFAMVSSQCLVTHEAFSISIRLFSIGCQDYSPKVAQICYQAKSYCHLLIEPVRRHLPLKASAVQSLPRKCLSEEINNDVNIELNDTGDKSMEIDDNVLSNSTNETSAEEIVQHISSSVNETVPSVESNIKVQLKTLDNLPLPASAHLNGAEVASIEVEKLNNSRTNELDATHIDVDDDLPVNSSSEKMNSVEKIIEKPISNSPNPPLKDIVLKKNVEPENNESVTSMLSTFVMSEPDH